MGDLLGHADGYQLPSPPRHRNGGHELATELVSHPMHRARPRRPAGGVPHQFPQPGLPGTRPATISFTSPKLSRNRHRQEPPEANTATASEPKRPPPVIQAPIATRHRNGEPRWPPELVSHPMHGAQSGVPAGGMPHQFPRTGPARERTPSDDLFHEPEAQPKTVTARSLPRPTRPPLRAGTATSSDTSR